MRIAQPSVPQTSITAVGQAAASQIALYDWVVNSQSFMGGAHQIAVAAVNSGVQLWNPAGSGGPALVDGLIVGMGATASQVTIRYGSAQLATLVAQIANKVGPGASLEYEIRTEGKAQDGTAFASFFVPANTSFLVPFTGPIYLSANAGLTVFATTVNIPMSATFWGRILIP